MGIPIEYIPILQINKEHVKVLIEKYTTHPMGIFAQITFHFFETSFGLCLDYQPVTFLKHHFDCVLIINQEVWLF